MNFLKIFNLQSSVPATTMAVDFVGIQSVEHLNRIFSVSSNFKQTLTAFKRSGHARFRRAPSLSSQSEENLQNKSVTDTTASSHDPCFKKSVITDTTASFHDSCLKKSVITDTTASFHDPCLKKSVTDTTASFHDPCFKKSVITVTTASFHDSCLKKSVITDTTVSFHDSCLKKSVITDTTASFHDPCLKKSVTDTTASLHDSCFKKSVADTTASFQDCCLKKHVTDNTTVSFRDCLKKSVITDKTAPFQSPTSSFASSLAGGSVEGSVSNGRQVSSLGIVAPAPSFSSRKPPLPSSHRKRQNTDVKSASVHRSGIGCHCCKRRKTGSKLKREVRRVPIIGSKVESISADDYTWKKYGEKKVLGSPFPRVYYKCNSGEGCPARKRVELAVTDSKMLIVTYDREHRH